MSTLQEELKSIAKKVDPPGFEGDGIQVMYTNNDDNLESLSNVTHVVTVTRIDRFWNKTAGDRGSDFTSFTQEESRKIFESRGSFRKNPQTMNIIEYVFGQASKDKNFNVYASRGIGFKATILQTEQTSLSSTDPSSTISPNIRKVRKYYVLPDVMIMNLRGQPTTLIYRDP